MIKEPNSFNNTLTQFFLTLLMSIMLVPVGRNVEASLTYGDGATADKVTQQLTGLNSTFPAVLPRGKLTKSVRIDIRADNLGLNNSFIGLNQLNVCYAQP